MLQTRNQRGFTLIELLIVVSIVSILALASVPLVTSNTEDARRTEAEAMLRTLKTQVCVEYTKTGQKPTTLKSIGIKSATRNGEYFRVQNKVRNSGLRDARLVAVALNGDDGKGHCHFTWDSGGSTMIWK